MAILKLENAGDTMTARIKQAETTAGKFGPQVKFEMENGDLLFISEPTAMRQLSRIPLEVGECAGETLVFSRDHNPNGKPYWGIRLAGAQDKAAPSKRMDSPYQAPSMGKPIKGLDDFPDEEYGRSVQSPSGPDDDDPYQNSGPIPPFHKVPPAVAKAAETAPNASKRTQLANTYLDLLAYVKTNGTLTDESAIQSAAATIFIQWKNAGVL
jgi:hypothetical protein